MKRLVPFVVILLLLAAGGAFLLFKRGKLSEGAQLIPADSLLYATVPDVRRTAERWPKTALAQIAAEPAMAEFLKKPLGLLSTQGGVEAMNQLSRVKPGRLFFAVTAVRETGGDLLLGFEFSGDRKEVDAAMDRLYHELEKSAPKTAKRRTADYQGDVLTSFAVAEPVLFSAVRGSWGFLSNSETAIKQALDRAAGREKTPSLAADDRFKTVRRHLATDPDFAWYGQPKPLVDVVLAIGEKQQPGAVNPKQLAQLEKIKALGGTLLLDGANQKESTFILYPEGPKLPAIDQAPMAFTTPETTFYYESTIDWSTVSSDDYLNALPPEAKGMLAATGVDLKQLPQMFGDDLGVIVNWPASAMIPAVLAVLEVKDRKRVEPLVDGLVSKLGAPTTARELHGARVFGLPTSMALIDPAIAVGDKFVYASLTGPELERALSVAPGSPTLDAAPAFKPALTAYNGKRQAFGYLDSKSLFEGIYNRVRPIAILAAAMSPDVGKFVEVDKLPETEVVSRHLAPIIYTNEQVADGWLIESSGPVTLSQVFFTTAVGAGAAWVSQALKNPNP